MHLYRTKKTKRPPRSFKEFNIKVQSYPMAVEMIDSGALIVQWGAPVSPEGGPADAVLAYIKTAPDQGGDVLMQVGKTIKMMTSDDFNAAPRRPPAERESQGTRSRRGPISNVPALSMMHLR